MNPRYPVYIISKGRWRSPLTASALENMGVDYSIVVEPHERAQYGRALPRSKILVLPFSNLGQGSIPARNWVWQHAEHTGAARHWILDDNLAGFVRLHRNLKIPVQCGSTFRAIEDFADRYTNVALAGMNYRFLADQRSRRPPFHMNTRIYSCILINHELDRDLDERWRGRYNEDTDLSLRALKAGWATVLFNAFLCNKIATMRMKGGNTDELYAEDGRLQMAQSLVDQHPDVARVSTKWGRHQHHVDYSPFKHIKLELKPDVTVRPGTDNFGMVLQHHINGRWVIEGHEHEVLPEQQLTLWDDRIAS